MPRPASRPNPAVWGLFSPLFAAHSPETPPFSRRYPAAFPAKPRRKLPFPRRSRPVFPVSARHCARLPPETRPLCAVSRRTRPLLPWQPGFFPLCARTLPAIPPVLRPKAPRAPPKPALRTRRRPEFRPRWGFRPARLCRFAVVKRVPPRGGLNLWERFSGDRRPLSREFSRNSGPGGLHKNRATVNKNWTRRGWKLDI